VLITFDDGYLDITRSPSQSFVPMGYKGFSSHYRPGWSCYVPWWDHIAYLMKTARRRRFCLRYPAELVVDFDKNSMANSLRDVSASIKGPRTPIRRGSFAT